MERGNDFASATSAPSGEPWQLKVCCVGAGYVGGPTMAVIAQHCPNVKVTVVDIDASRINSWNSSNLPIYEIGLNEIVQQVRGTNLFFTTSCDQGIAEADVVFIAVNTPTKEYGLGKGSQYDLRAWEIVARNISRNSSSSKIVVEKSTVPVRTAELVQRILVGNRQSEDVHFQVLSNPEFLAEGKAIENLQTPDRVLIGGDESTVEGRKAIETLAALYAHWIPEERIVRQSAYSAELAKLTSNAFLAQRVSSINSISAVCEATGANVHQVAHAIGMDARIGPRFLQASLGFGGSCFKKDVLGLVYLCETFHLQEVADYWRCVVSMNDYQKRRFCERMLRAMFGTLRGKRIVLMGMAFKEHTGDTRESPAIDVARFLLEEGAVVHVYDPVVKACDILDIDKRLVVEPSVLQASKGAHALVVCTEWTEFKSLNYEAIFSNMQKPAFVFDGRSILDHEALEQLGFDVYAIGRPTASGI